MRYVITGVFCTLAMVGAYGFTAQDPVKVSPTAYKVVLENDQVRVLEMRLKPGQQDEPHSHPREVVYFVNAGHAEITLPDGKVIDKPIAAGEVLYNEAWSHRVKNVGKTEILASIVEFKK